MPITDALKTAKQLQQAGLPAAAAELLAEKFEETAQATQADLKDFIRQEFAQFRAEVRGELNTRFAEQEAKFERAMRTQLMAIIAIVSLAVAIIKLFPNWH